MSDLYEKIFALCKKKGISGYKLCKDIGMQPSLLTDLKMGRQASLSAKNMDKVASYFGVSVGYLLGTEQKENAPTADGERMMRGVPDDETLRLLELLENRPDIRYLAAASERATPEHVRATAKMFDELYGRSPDE